MPRPRMSVAAFLACALLLAGCTGAAVERVASPSSLYQRGLDRFGKGDYYEAIKIFEELIRNHPGSEYIDDGIYHLGRAYLENDDYALAVAEFDQLVADHPESPFVPEAEFYTGESYFRQMRSPQYDPEMTEQALSRFRRFARLFPDHPLRAEAEKRIARCRDWLAEKNVLAARQYARLGYHDSARIFYQKVIDMFADSRWVPLARLGIGRSYEEMGNAAAARDAYRSLLEDSQAIPAEVRREAEHRLRALEGRS